MSKYKYAPLDCDANQIRLATILPSSNSDSDIHLRLGIDIISDYVIPKYEALSYVWGSTQNPATVYIEGARLSVTRSLGVALTYLRYKSKPRMLWIDAICVNQEDLVERSKQVEKMAALYKGAERVVVWLGPGSAESNLAFQVMESWCTQISYDIEKDLAYPPIKSGLPWTKQDSIMPYDEEAIRSVTSLLKREWFGRLWIFQEIRLANDQSIIQAGDEYVLWKHFISSCYYLRKKFESFKGDDVLFTEFTKYYLRMQPMGLGHPQVFEDLQRLTWDTRHTKCTDPRDRVYGILSLVHKSSAISLLPDYTKPVGIVYQDAVLHILQCSKSLRILTRCEMDTDAKEEDTCIPSWTPNFAVPSRYKLPLRDMNAMGDSLAHARFLGRGILGVKGMRIAIIASVHSLSLASISEVTCVKLIQNLVSTSLRAIVQNTSLGRDDESILSACCRAFNRNLFLDYWLPPKGHYPTFPQGQKALDDILNWPEDKDLDDLSNSTLRYIRNFRSLATGRAFFITCDGNVGLAPSAVTTDDILVGLLGVDSVMAFREAGNGFFRVVGEAYLDGFTTGETLLGKFKNSWVRMSRFDEETKAYWPAYFNKRTREIQVDDPRLGPLPEGWKIQEHKEMRLWNWYVREDDLEIARQSEYERWRSDPRLAPEWLKKRGVSLEEYKLI